MAKVSAGAGYRELKRVGNYVAPNVQRNTDRLANQVEQNRARKERQKVRDDKRLDDALSNINVDTDALHAKATGFETRDDLARDFAMAATKRSEEYAEKAREAAANQDWVAMNNWKGKINRIKGDFKNTVNDEAILKESMDKYKSSWQNGEIDDDEWLDFAESMENFNYEITLDDNDNKVIRAIVLDDEGKPELDDSGNPKIIEKQWSDVVNQKDRPFEVLRLEDKEGKKGLIGDLLSTMGKRKYDETTGQYITTTQTWDEEAEQQFQSKVRGLQANDRNMHSLLKQATGGQVQKKKDFTDEDKQTVEDFLRFQVKGGYDTQESKKVRSRTPEEMALESARNRATTRRGQDLAQQRAEEDDKIAWDKNALAWWKAKNPNTAKGGKGSKEEEKTAKIAKLYDIAKQISKTDLNDEAVQNVLDETGLGFTIGTDWQFGAGINNLFGGDYNQFDIGRVKNIDQKDVFKIVKGLAKKVELELEDTDIRDVIMSEPKQKDSEKPTAADLINKYSKK